MSEYPMHGYLYDADGRHGPPVKLYNREELHTFLRMFGTVALQSQRLFLVVSGDDEDRFFHIEGGHVVYASGVDPATVERGMRHGQSLEATS